MIFIAIAILLTVLVVLSIVAARLMYKKPRKDALASYLDKQSEHAMRLKRPRTYISTSPGQSTLTYVKRQFARSYQLTGPSLASMVYT